MGIRSIWRRLFGKDKKDISKETTKRLQDAGVSEAPYPPGVSPGQSDTSVACKEKSETVERLRGESLKKHQEVRAKLKAMP